MSRSRWGLVVLSVFCLGVVSGGGLLAQVLIRQQAPTDRAVDILDAEIVATIAQMDAENRPTVRFVEGGRFNINIRRIKNAETALRHPTTNDVYVVREGSGTLVTGGVMVDQDGQTVDGDRAASIRGGEERTIGAGDLVFIPAGVPHGIKDTDGITWFNIRFD